MSNQPNVFDQPTVVANYDAATVPVPVYLPRKQEELRAGTGHRRLRVALALFFLAVVLLTGSLMGYEAWAR